MPVILDFRTFGHSEAQTAENLHNLVAHKREGMTCAQGDRAGRTAQVESVVEGLRAFRGGFKCVDFLGGEKFQRVYLHSDGLLLVGRHVAEVSHKIADLTLLGEVFDSEGFHLFRSGGLEGLDLSLETMDFF